MGMLLYMEEMKRKEAAEKAKAEEIPFSEPPKAAVPAPQTGIRTVIGEEKEAKPVKKPVPRKRTGQNRKTSK